jgi:hypothetical protein
MLRLRESIVRHDGEHVWASGRTTARNGRTASPESVPDKSRRGSHHALARTSAVVLPASAALSVPTRPPAATPPGTRIRALARFKLADHILKTNATDFDPSQFVDHYEQALLEMLKKKQAGIAVSRSGAKDENGNFVVEAIRPPKGKMIRFILEWQRPENWGKDRKIDVPQQGGILVIGDAKKPENSSAASIISKPGSGSRRRQ